MRTLKLALRTLVHYRLYSLINLLGLALSLTCVVIIARYVHSELTVDRFNTKLDRIYMITSELYTNPGERTYSDVDYIRDGQIADITKHPGIEKRSLFLYLSDMEVTYNNQSYNNNMLVIDTVFLQILDYPVIAGTNNLRRPEDALITETLAAKIFGEENPVGKTLFSSTVGKTVTVAGIIRTPTHKSALPFDMLISSQLRNTWHGYGSRGIILLHPGVDYRDVNRQHGDFVEIERWKLSFRYNLFPYRDAYFDRSITDYGMFVHGNLTYIFILSSIGVLLLLIGLTNYINIHSVVMTRRNKELGMKKVFGAGGGSIFRQLALENLLLTVASLVGAFWLAATLSPIVENTFGIRQYPNLRFDAWLALALIVVLPIAVSVAPYLRYRYFSPLRSLRAVNAGNRSLLSRMFFIVFQYFMTMGLMSVSLFFVKQLDFMMNKDLGFRMQNIISVPFSKYSLGVLDSDYREKEKKKKAVEAELKHKLNASPLIESWCYGNFPFVNHETELKMPGKELQKVTATYADEMWLNLFDISLLDGELWNNDNHDGSSYPIIVSESTLKQFGITNYRDAELYSSLEFVGTTKGVIPTPPYRIIGVVKDFYTAHLSKQLAPTIIHQNKRYSNNTNPVLASFAPENRQKVIDLMKNLHDELVGGEFTYSFIEDEIAKLYGEDRKVAIICSAFTGIAIVISMLGLLGISLFDIRQRRKEIAIRKINGAEVPDILRLLMRKYFVLLGIAFVVATPASLFAIYKYLENFAYKAPISWWLFAIALFTTIAVSLATLIYQTYKAGNENPATVIKSEL
jgi:ABC-type antimicrobial peptide transport system permease subunit